MGSSTPTPFFLAAGVVVSVGGLVMATLNRRRSSTTTGLVGAIVRSFSRTQNRRRGLLLIILIVISSWYYALIYTSLQSENTGEGTPAKAVDLNKYKIIVLAGQSNMAGRGGLIFTSSVNADETKVKKIWDPARLSSEAERSLTVPDTNVIRLSKQLEWVPAIEPLHQDIDDSKTCGIGPGLIFARKLGGRVALLPCAVGGTKIEKWSKNSELYQQMLARTKFATGARANHNVDAVLWYQGEADCNNENDAILYASRLQDFIQDLRRDLNQPNLIIIMVAVHAAKAGVLPYGHVIREAIYDLAAKDKFIKVVDAKDPETSFLEDDLHLSSRAQFALAGRLYDAFLELSPTKS